MCGIAGFIDRSIAPDQTRNCLEGMLATIRHRGPDGEGILYYEPSGLAMGMRRLSIIDLEGGAQPIWNEDRTIAVIFNGEIYNHVELRGRLERNGHVFRTSSDTEVLVHLYEEHGQGLVHALRGMFAFAIFDRRRRRLLLARDHFGQKPLYYVTKGTKFAFASELKALVTLPWVSRERDPDAFLTYCAWLSLPAPRTHFRQIHKVPPGFTLTLEGSGDIPAEPRMERYWRYDLSKPATITEMDEAARAVDEGMRDSVRLHLRADVPVGVLLSSGLDSRIISSYAQELQGGQLETFTVGFEGENSEAEGAAQTASEIGSKHHALQIGAKEYHESLERVAWHLDEPIGDPAAAALLQVCELARQHVKVLLSGEGADEFFAGYDGRYLGMLSAIERTQRLNGLGHILPKGNLFSASRRERFFARSHLSRREEAVALRIEGFPGDVRNPRGLDAGQLIRVQERISAFGQELVRPQHDVLSELLTLDIQWQLAESLLQKADKMSMAASIELRTPFVDVEIAALAANSGSALKLPPEGPGKLVLRHCLARRLQEPMTRPKRGFPLPLEKWFTGPLKGAVAETILDPGAACLQHLDRARLEQAWQDFQRGEWPDGARAFYALWIYEMWSRNFPA